MNIIEPKVELIKQDANDLIKGLYRHIEYCGRTCYKSEDKITEDSAEEFVNRMIKNGHTAMLEHGTVYLTLVINDKVRDEKVHYPWYYDNADARFCEIFSYIQSIFISNPYSITKLIQNQDYTETTMCITTNYRVIVENGWEGIMKDFISVPTLHHIPRITLKFTTNIGVTREGNRMRANSIAEESTRYCDYTKEKHGNGQLNIVPPVWLKEDDVKSLQYYNEEDLEIVLDYFRHENAIEVTDTHLYAAALVFSNLCYNKLREKGWAPQQAREVLPLATKSDIVYTAFPHQWRHWFDLRLFGTTGKPHPNMEDISSIAQGVLMQYEYNGKSYWDIIYPSNTPTPTNN